MKKIIIAFSVIMISSSIYTQAGPQTGFYSGGHDSLIFDGTSEIATIPTSRTNECYIRVIYANGNTQGTYFVTKTYEVCTVQDKYETTETGPLSPMNELKLGEEITTGDNSSLEMQFQDGSRIRLGPNSKIRITGDMCDRRTLIEQMAGKMWNSVKKLLGSQKYEVKTDRCANGVRGTEFSVEITNDENIIRVYEGSVEVQNELQIKEYQKNTKDKGPEMTQLTKDYQSGKISIEEFSKKMSELQKEITVPQSLITVNAGFQSNVIGMENPTEPVPIESTGNEWFDDVNFKK